MPLSPVSLFYAISDAKIYKLLTDPAGGSATYGTAVDVPGIKAMTITGTVSTVDLRGDNTLLDSHSSLTNLTVSISYAKLSLDVLPIVVGGTTTAAGTTPNQTQSWKLNSSNTFNYFKIEGKTPTGGSDTPTGDNHIVLPKCILSSYPEQGFAEEDYRIFSMDARVMPLLSTGDWQETKYNETATAIA